MKWAEMHIIIKSNISSQIVIFAVFFYGFKDVW